MLLSREQQKEIDRAIGDLEQAARGQKPDQGLTRALALAILGLHDQLSKVRADQEYILRGLRSVLKALADDHQEVKDFLKGSRGETPRWDD